MNNTHLTRLAFRWLVDDEDKNEEARGIKAEALAEWPGKEQKADRVFHLTRWLPDVLEESVEASDPNAALAIARAAFNLVDWDVLANWVLNDYKHFPPLESEPDFDDSPF